jgi:hypothetical protein
LDPNRPKPAAAQRSAGAADRPLHPAPPAMAPLRAVVDSTRLEDKVGDFLVRANGSEPAESESDDDGDGGGGGGRGRVVSCDSCMCFVFEGLGLEYLEAVSRSAANLQVFLFLVQVFSFYKIRTGMMFEDVRVRKGDVAQGDYRHAEPSDELLEFMRDVPLTETTDANLKYYLHHHAQKRGEFSCGMRAWIFLPENINLPKVLRQFLTKEMGSRLYREQNKHIPAKIAEIASVTTYSRLLSVACGDQDYGGRGQDIAHRHMEFSGDADERAMAALDPRVHFNACVQIQETADILMSASGEAMAALMHTDPSEYGTLVERCDGTVEEAADDMDEDADGEDADAAADGGGGGGEGGGRRGRVGGVSDARGAGSGFGQSRALSPDFLKPATPSMPKSGTLRTPRVVRIIGLAYECMATLLAQGDMLPYSITPAQQFHMQYISSEDLDPRIPIYLPATPVHQRVSMSQGGAAAREQKEQYEARHAASATLEQIAVTHVIPGSGEQRSKKRRGIDSETLCTDIEVETNAIRAKIDRTVAWCTDSPASPFAGRDDLATNLLLSELLEMVKLGMLHHFFAVFFSPQARACDFVFKIQEAFEENLTPDKWRARQLSDYRRDSPSCIMDPWSFCGVTETVHGLFDAMDCVDRLYSTHNVQLAMWTASMGAAMPTDGGHRKCLHNKMFAGPRDCSKTFNMTRVQSKMPAETFMAVHHQTAAFATGTAVDHNGNETSAQQYKTAFEDEAGVNQLGLSDSGASGKLHQKVEFDAALNKRKELLGNSDTIVSHRAFTNDDGHVHIHSKNHHTVGATITGTNSGARPDKAIASRYTAYYMTGFDGGMAARGGITKREVMGSTDEDSIKTGERKAYEKGRFQTVYTIVALCMQMRHAGLLDFSAQDKMTRNLLVAVMKELDECNDSRELYKVLGEAEGLSVLIRVVGGIFHAQGLQSLGVQLTELQASEDAPGRRVDHTLDTTQPYAVPFAIWQIMRRAMAPSPVFAMYAIGDTIGVVHSDITKKLLLVKLGEICGLRHFDYKAAKRKPGADAALDGYARELKYVQECVLAGETAGGDPMAKETLCLEYLDTHCSMDEVVQQLKTGGLSETIVRTALESLRDDTFSETRRPTQEEHWNADVLDAEGARGPKRNAVWKVSGVAAAMRPDRSVMVLKDLTKRGRVLVSVGAVLAAVESLDLQSLVRSKLGPHGEQKLPKTYSEWGQGAAKQDEVRRAMAKCLPKGLPKYASYLDGMLPVAQQQGKDPCTWYATPGVFCPDAMVGRGAAAAAAAAADAPSTANRGFHTLGAKTAMDGVLGSSRASRLGFDAASATARDSLFNRYQVMPEHDPAYTSVYTRWAYVSNGCYEQADDGQVALMFPAPAASIAAVSGPDPGRYMQAPENASLEFRNIYPDCFINGRDGRNTSDVDVSDDRLGDGCCPVKVAKGRASRDLCLEDEWVVHQG